MLFTAFAFGRIVSDTSWVVLPAAFTLCAVLAAIFWLAVVVRRIRRSRHASKRLAVSHWRLAIGSWRMADNKSPIANR
jgi:hypothetical protein